MVLAVEPTVGFRRTVKMSARSTIPILLSFTKQEVFIFFRKTKATPSSLRPCTWATKCHSFRFLPHHRHHNESSHFQVRIFSSSGSIGAAASFCCESSGGSCMDRTRLHPKDCILWDQWGPKRQNMQVPLFCHFGGSHVQMSISIVHKF